MLVVTLFLLSVLLSCAKKETTLPEAAHTASDPALGLIVADTITYDVVITNADPENTWDEERLRGLDHKALIDNIFNMIYAGKADVYDYNTKNKLDGRDIEKIEQEPDYDRSQIGMIQFTEIWYLDPEKGDLTKRVHSMVLGYNYYTSDGALFGHSPMFRIVLKG